LKDKKINIVTYNLHGLQKNDEWRFGKIAYELSKRDAHICGFQEVINGNGVEDTSYQVAYHLRNITGLPYNTHWLYCHNFNETYPEGLSLLSSYPITSPVRIDLNEKLSCKENPLLPRFALSCEFKIGHHKILFTTLHLDHHKERTLRASQAEKLIKELGETFTMEDYACSVITGDFNDLDKSPCLNYFKKQGYKDSYRELHKKWGNTFHSSRPTVRIDYILIKGDVKIEKSELILYNSKLSDHVGILTTIILSSESKKEVKKKKKESEEGSMVSKNEDKETEGEEIVKEPETEKEVS